MKEFSGAAFLTRPLFYAHAMTLICAFASPSVGLVAISDIIVSHGWQGKMPKVRLPFRPDGLQHRFRDRVVSGTEQKSVIIGRTLIQWSGSVDIARKLISHLRAITNEGQNFVSPERLFEDSGLNEYSKNRIILIYHFNVDEMHIKKWHWRAATKSVGDTELYYQGSGVPQYFWNTDIKAPDGKSSEEVLIGEAFARATTQLASEARSNARYDDMFGGWLEFIQKTDRTFAKIRYAIKFWRVNNKRDVIGADPLFFCWYIENDLVVCRLDWVEFDGGLRVKPDLFPIRDFLKRPGVNPNELPKFEYDPYMICHFILNVDTGQIRQLIAFHYDDAGFNASVNDGGVDITPSADFFDKLHDASDDAWMIKADETADD